MGPCHTSRFAGALFLREKTGLKYSPLGTPTPSLHGPLLCLMETWNVPISNIFREWFINQSMWHNSSFSHQQADRGVTLVFTGFQSAVKIGIGSFRFCMLRSWCFLGLTEMCVAIMNNWLRYFHTTLLVWKKPDLSFVVKFRWLARKCVCLRMCVCLAFEIYICGKLL